MKGSVDYHKRVDFRALDVFVDAVSHATRDELKGAVKTASEFSKDLAINPSERPIWKRLATLLRAELKGYAKNPSQRSAHEKGFIIEDKSPKGCAYVHKQIKGFIEHGRPGAIYECNVCHEQFTVPARKKNPEIEIHELILWAENSPRLSNQFISIMKNLSRKHKKGNYDSVLAAKLWKYWVDESVKDYNKEVLGGGYSLRQNVFTIQDRKDAAIELESQWRDDVRGGEYLTLSNPSQRKKITRKKNSVGAVKSTKAPLKIFEIYTKHPTTGESGWEIEWVRSTEKEIKSYPNFDVVITRNDFPMSGDRSVIKDWYLRKNPKDKNPYDGKGKHILFVFGQTGPIQFIAKHGKAWQLLPQISRANRFATNTAASEFSKRAQLKRGQKIGIMKASLPKSFAAKIVKISRGK